MKEDLKKFKIELDELFDKYNIYIDCHAEFNSLIRDRSTDEVLALLYHDCEIDFDI